MPPQTNNRERRPGTDGAPPTGESPTPATATVADACETASTTLDSTVTPEGVPTLTEVLALLRAESDARPEQALTDAAERREMLDLLRKAVLGPAPPPATRNPPREQVPPPPTGPVLDVFTPPPTAAFLPSRGGLRMRSQTSTPPT